MRPVIEQRWDVTPAQAVDIQHELASRVITTVDFTRIETVAGLDVGVKGDRARAAVAVYSYPALELLEEHAEMTAVAFPYVPGLLSFREVPVLLGVLDRLTLQPDLLLCDGQGIAHPRGFGLACHLGVLYGVPSVGCAKTHLWGRYTEPAAEKGSGAPLRARGEVVGVALRTRDRVKPVFVSPGHRISLDTAVQIVLDCCTRYRRPDPLRRAHALTLMA